MREQNAHKPVVRIRPAAKLIGCDAGFGVGYSNIVERGIQKGDDWIGLADGLRVNDSEHDAGLGHHRASGHRGRRANQNRA